MSGRDRPAERDRSRTGRVAGAALRGAGGSRQAAAARLRLQAQAAVVGAWTALENNAGDERALQLLDTARRRLVAAGGLDRGEWAPAAETSPASRARRNPDKGFNEADAGAGETLPRAGGES